MGSLKNSHSTSAQILCQWDSQGARVSRPRGYGCCLSLRASSMWCTSSSCWKLCTATMCGGNFDVDLMRHTLLQRDMGQRLVRSIVFLFIACRGRCSVNELCMLQVLSCCGILLQLWDLSTRSAFAARVGEGTEPANFRIPS